MSTHLADPWWRCPPVLPSPRVGGTRPPPPRYTPASVVKRALLMQPRTRVARARCARDSSLRYPLACSLSALITSSSHRLSLLVRCVSFFFCRLSLSLSTFFSSLSLHLSAEHLASPAIRVYLCLFSPQPKLVQA